MTAIPWVIVNMTQRKLIRKLRHIGVDQRVRRIRRKAIVGGESAVLCRFQNGVDLIRNDVQCITELNIGVAVMIDVTCIKRKPLAA